MKQIERSSIMRILSDMIKADAIVDLRELNFLEQICEKYNIKFEDKVRASSITLEKAVNTLCNCPESFKQDFITDIESIIISDNICTREEAILLTSLRLSLTQKKSCCGLIFSVEVPKKEYIDNSQVLYIEGEYYKELNDEIISNYRDITNEFKLIGLNFVYLPMVCEYYKHLSKEELKCLIKFLYPTINDIKLTNVIKQIVNISSVDFCKEQIIEKFKLRSLEYTLPTLLFKINHSIVDNYEYVNFFSVTIEEDILLVVREICNVFTKNFQPRILNFTYEEKGRFVYRGYYKQIFDMFINRKGVKSSVVVDFIHRDILLPEAGVKLSKLHRREKALYTLFLLESTKGGIKFNKPITKGQLERYNHRMENLQKKYELIYKNFGGEERNAPIIEKPENRMPMISLIKRQFLDIASMLDNVENYIIKKNIFGNYSVSLSPELCLCFDSELMIECKFADSKYLQNLLAI